MYHLRIIPALLRLALLVGCGAITSNATPAPAPPTSVPAPAVPQAAPTAAPAATSAAAPGASAAPKIALKLVSDALDRPVYVTHAGDGSGRLFVVEKAGRIVVLSGGRPDAEPFLDIRDR